MPNSSYTSAIGRGGRLEEDPAVSTVGSPPILGLLIGLRYAVSELQKDADKAVQLLPHHEREGAKTKFAVFVVHNKLKPKLGSLPNDIPLVPPADILTALETKRFLVTTQVRRWRTYGEWTVDQSLRA